jgi:hypothetical protein
VLTTNTLYYVESTILLTLASVIFVLHGFIIPDWLSSVWSCAVTFVEAAAVHVISYFQHGGTHDRLHCPWDDTRHAPPGEHRGPTPP